PWSPSPIAWSRVVSSSAWRSIVAATALTSSARNSAPKAIPLRSNPLAVRAEIQRLAQGNVDSIADRQVNLRIDQGHQLVRPDRERQVVLVPQMLDPLDPSMRTAVGAGNPHMLGPRADGPGAGRRRMLREGGRREEGDRGHAQT